MASQTRLFGPTDFTVAELQEHKQMWMNNVAALLQESKELIREKQELTRDCELHEELEILYRKQLARYITLDRRHTRKTAKDVTNPDRRCKLTPVLVKDIRNAHNTGGEHRLTRQKLWVEPFYGVEDRPRPLLENRQLKPIPFAIRSLFTR